LTNRKHICRKGLITGLILMLGCLSACNNRDPKTQSGIPAADSIEVFRLKAKADSLSWYEPDSAIRLYQRALQLSRAHHYTLGITENLIGLGFVSINHARYADGFTYVEEGIRHLSSLKKPDHKSLATLYNNMGAIYLHTGNYEEAAAWCYKADSIAEKSKDYGFIARSANNFAAILSETGEWDRALSYIQQGKEIAMKHNTPRYLSYLNLNEARVKYWKHQYDEALHNCEQALETATNFRQVSARHDIIHLSGLIYEAKGQPEQARECYRKVLDMESDYPIGRMRAAMSMGQLELRTGNLTLAGQYLNTAQEMARQLNARKELAEIYEHLTRYYRRTGEYNRAFDYQERATALKDSILNLEKITAVNLLEVKYRMAQKDKELAENKLMIASQKAKIVRNNLLIWGLLLAALITALILRISYRNRQRSEKQKREIAVWQALSEGEEKERTRIARELHDGIGGLLSTLKMQLAILGKRMPEVRSTDVYQEANTLLDNTITEVRKTAHNLMPELILRHGLVEAIRIFCSNLQNDEGLKTDFQYYGYIGNLAPGFQLAVYRIIQELLQNVLKHAESSTVLVQLSRHSDVLDITVEDNGKGFDVTAERKGMGLNSIERRVKEMSGNMHIRSVPGKGTNIYIEFHIADEQEAGDHEPGLRTSLSGR
jgi:signal transduction histidine kinase/Tfp pilus assembly protein PilF